MKKNELTKIISEIKFMNSDIVNVPENFRIIYSVKDFDCLISDEKVELFQDLLSKLYYDTNKICSNISYDLFCNEVFEIIYNKKI